MNQTAQRSIPVTKAEWMQALFGSADEHARLVKEAFGVEMVARQEAVLLLGPDAGIKAATQLVEGLLAAKDKGETLTPQKVAYLISLIQDDQVEHMNRFMEEPVYMTAKGRMIKSKTLGQAHYIRTMQQKDLAFGIGPAGTGKTYLAVAMAVKAFGSREVNKIILTRPAIEAGESLGFLPGDLKDKIDPYLRPLYDSLFDILGVDKFQKYMERGLIEVAPLAYMRGRTLDHAFVILDEAQNTTREQMKMFLTRLGIGSKAVVTGDITQIDLPRGKSSGLVEALDVVKSIPEIGIVYLNDKDVVRHTLVQKIIRAYEASESQK
ncbi:PhoH family protein [Anoxynatronum sibiricum]|uniref:PhoH family protein n=1 Tax=Anoxynatronum sibiricum TaxID=210623 RepID=UPI003CCCEC58